MAASKVARDNVLDPPSVTARRAPPSAELSAPNQRLAQLGGALVVAVIAVASLAAYMPINPAFPTTGLDSAWAFALNAAVARGLVFGRDIVFTFGPYAAAYTAQYHPGTDVLALWTTGFLGTAFACSLMCLSRGAGRIGAAALAIGLVLLTRDTLFFVLPVAFVLLICRGALPATDPYRIDLSRPVRSTLVLLVLALSLTTLVKGTFIVAAVAGIAVGAAVLFARGHKALGVAFAVLFAAAIPVFWLTAQQPLSALPGFFVAQIPIVSGYSAAMSIAGVGGHPILFAVCALAVGLIYARFIARAGFAGTAMWFGVALLVFVSFKAGFVRADWHVTIAAGTLVAVAWMLALGTPRLGAALGVAIALVGWAIVRRDALGLGPEGMARTIHTTYAATATRLVQRISAPERLVWDYQDSLGAIRAAQPLPEIEGSVDVYSYGQSMVLARNLNWAPRPVLQSYSAYTPQLEALNAAHLAGSAAPATVLFTVQPIDHHLAALEDGASWPALLTQYEVTAVRGDVAVLSRRPGASASSALSAHPVSSATYELGQSISLPANVPIVWARIDARLTALGKLAAFIDKPPDLNIVYRFADGSERQFRYIAAMGQAGFVASPLVEDTTDLFALELPSAGTYFAGRRPLSIAVEANSGAGSLWERSLPVAFYALAVPPAAIGPVLLDKAGPLIKHHPQLTEISDCGLDIVNAPPLANPTGAARFLRAVAWVALPDGVTSDLDAASFTLTGPNGFVRMIPARKIPRGDVGGYVDLPSFPETTYAVTADLGGLRAGSYVVGLQALRGGRKFTCTSRDSMRFGHVVVPPALPR